MVLKGGVTYGPGVPSYDSQYPPGQYSPYGTPYYYPVPVPGQPGPPGQPGQPGANGEPGPATIVDNFVGGVPWYAGSIYEQLIYPYGSNALNSAPLTPQQIQTQNWATVSPKPLEPLPAGGIAPQGPLPGNDVSYFPTVNLGSIIPADNGQTPGGNAATLRWQLQDSISNLQRQLELNPGHASLLQPQIDKWTARLNELDPSTPSGTPLQSGTGGAGGMVDMSPAIIEAARIGARNNTANNILAPFLNQQSPAQPAINAPSPFLPPAQQLPGYQPTPMQNVPGVPMPDVGASGTGGLPSGLLLSAARSAPSAANGQVSPMQGLAPESMPFNIPPMQAQAGAPQQALAQNRPLFAQAAASPGFLTATDASIPDVPLSEDAPRGIRIPYAESFNPDGTPKIAPQPPAGAASPSQQGASAPSPSDIGNGAPVDSERQKASSPNPSNVSTFNQTFQETMASAQKIYQAEQQPIHNHYKPLLDGIDGQIFQARRALQNDLEFKRNPPSNADLDRMAKVKVSLGAQAYKRAHPGQRFGTLARQAMSATGLMPAYTPIAPLETMMQKAYTNLMEQSIKERDFKYENINNAIKVDAERVNQLEQERIKIEEMYRKALDDVSDRVTQTARTAVQAGRADSQEGIASESAKIHQMDVDWKHQDRMAAQNTANKKVEYQHQDRMASLEQKSRIETAKLGIAQQRADIARAALDELMRYHEAGDLAKRANALANFRRGIASVGLYDPKTAKQLMVESEPLLKALGLDADELQETRTATPAPQPGSTLPKASAAQNDQDFLLSLPKGTSKEDAVKQLLKLRKGK